MLLESSFYKRMCSHNNYLPDGRSHAVEIFFNTELTEFRSYTENTIGLNLCVTLFLCVGACPDEGGVLKFF